MRARRLNVAALGPWARGLGVPGVNIEMGPGAARPDKTGEEQRRRHRAGEAAAPGVVEIGEAALDHRFIGPPQRHAPERIGDALAASAISPASESSSV